ncbi:MAG TPA: putative toxin-antitoxin system toxin component, PIN family [Terracidiphilus sp.]|nr:putative toxin-antitoxin system toxin component, PIN family [Terracidiphilus sp.]
MSQRVLFDTSTLIGAVLRPGSVPNQALRKALDVYQLCSSAEMVAELERVLARPHFAKYASIDARAAFIDLIRRNAQMHVVTDLDLANLTPRCRDPKDDIVLALAVAANADTIVSSDQGSAGAASLARGCYYDAGAVCRAICSLRIFPYEYFPSASTLY